MSYPWPVAECLHEHKQEQEVVMNFIGEVVRYVPAWCPECGHRWEIED
jgi:hypothetical protein